MKATLFANPIGHSLREGTRGIFQALLDGAGPEPIRHHLLAIVRIRAVQEIPASEAVGFIFVLKTAVRAELEPAQRRQFAIELTRLDQAIDRVALAAFDLYVQCRQRVGELQINEIKRRVAWVVGKMDGGVTEAAPVPVEQDRPHWVTLTIGQS